MGIPAPPDYTALLEDKDKKIFEGKPYHYLEPLVLALIRKIDKLIKGQKTKGL